MLCSKDFFNKSEYNAETKEQMWLSIIGDSHDSICKCQFCFAHLLACIFPLGHSDRNKTINEILERDYKEKCLSSGGGDAASSGQIRGIKEENTTEEKDGQIEEEDDADLANLLAAVEEEGDTR